MFIVVPVNSRTIKMDKESLSVWQCKLILPFNLFLCCAQAGALRDLCTARSTGYTRTYTHTHLHHISAMSLSVCGLMIWTFAVFCPQRAPIMFLLLLPPRGEQRVHKRGDRPAPACIPHHRKPHPSRADLHHTSARWYHKPIVFVDGLCTQNKIRVMFAANALQRSTSRQCITLNIYNTNVLYSEEHNMQINIKGSCRHIIYFSKSSITYKYIIQNAFIANVAFFKNIYYIISILDVLTKQTSCLKWSKTVCQHCTWVNVNVDIPIVSREVHQMLK